MAITNGYAELSDLKGRLGITDTTDDSIIENVIEAASRAIDRHCHRRFYGVSETRYYTAEHGDALYLPDDLISVTTLKTDEDGDRTYEVTWATTDYDLLPYNAATDGIPYGWLETTPDGSYSFPANIKRGVEIAGVFGYVAASTAAPDDVREACLLQATRLFKRKDTPFGLAGSPELGQGRMTTIPKLDPDVQVFLAPYRRITAWAT